MLEPDRRGQGWQQCHNPAPRWIKVARRRETRRWGVIRKESTSLRDAGTEQSNPGTGEEKTVFGRRTTHQEVGQATVSGV